MLKGQAKKDYQREYMRNYRLKKQVVRPYQKTKALDPVDVPIEVVCDGKWHDLPERFGGVQVCAEPIISGIVVGVSEIDADGNPIPEYW